MKLTKEDYMRLPKERLAELLAEMDDVKIESIQIPEKPNNIIGWCDGTVCTNPQMDCIGCPRTTTGKPYTSPNTDTEISTLKAEEK